MKIKKLIPALLLWLLAAGALSAQTKKPVTLPFAEKGDQTLYLDYYAPDAESDCPTILFVFGGSFYEGSRSREMYLPWFDRLTEEGYPVVTIDYRLGMTKEGYRFGLFDLLPTARRVQDAVDMAIEDLFSATRWLLDHGTEHGIPTDRIVATGSSAGAMTVLGAEWELCNRSERAEVLPEDFDYAGVIAYAGAILTHRGTPTYRREPCPQLLLHGTADKTVLYDHLSLGPIHWTGSAALAEIYRRQGYNYSIYRFVGHKHEIATAMLPLWDETKKFLEQNVIAGTPLIVDATLDGLDVKR